MTLDTDWNDRLPSRHTTIDTDGRIRITEEYTVRLPALVTAGPALPDLEAMTRRIASRARDAAAADDKAA